MQCPRCNQLLDDDTVFCGNCGAQVAPLQAQGATVAGPVGDLETLHVRPGAIGNMPTTQPPVLQKFSPRTTSYGSAPTTPAQANAPQPPRQGGSPLASARLRIIMALALIVIAGGTLGLLAILRNNGTNTTVGANASGQVAFIDSASGIPGHTDALKINIQGLQASPSGSQYDAWLVNDASEQIIALGKLTANGQTFTLSYTGDGSSGQAGTNLLGAGDKVEISLDQGAVTSPAGKIVLSATFPPQAFVHIKHLLFSFPITPGKISLLVGLLGQAQLLNSQAVLLQNAAAGHHSSAVQCASQSLIDIIEGAHGSAYQPLSPVCVSQNISVSGDGFGLLGNSAYVALAAEHASLAATQSDSTDNIRQHAQQVELAMTNIKGWATTIEGDALALRAAPGNTAVIQQIITLSDNIFHGSSGEAGVISAYNEGQLMATLQLVPGV